MALGTTLPAWPALVFAYFEPISLVLGFYTALSNPSAFVTAQIPTTSSTLTPVPPSALILANTLGNIYALLAGLAVVCTFITREPRVTWWYLFFVACGDIGHLYASYAVMGRDVFLDVGGWNAMVWGNVGVTAFLHVNRGLTIVGAFGKSGAG
ncbi:hypothetical protein EK21DRAFT_33200, partial [Setomelanomma holmii]